MLRIFPPILHSGLIGPFCGSFSITIVSHILYFSHFLKDSWKFLLLTKMVIKDHCAAQQLLLTNSKSFLSLLSFFTSFMNEK